MNDNRKQLFSKKIPAGRRTYFFDIRETCEGMKYLVITETGVSKTGNSCNRIMVFEENLSDFISALEEVTSFMGFCPSEQSPGSHSMEVIRQKYPNAYKKWTPEEDEHLKRAHLSGVEIEQLAKLFQRQPSAIESRLGKLGLS